VNIKMGPGGLRAAAPVRPRSGGRSHLREGRPFPLGATWDGLGVNFALFSANATKMELCLFDEAGEREVERVILQGLLQGGVGVLRSHRDLSRASRFAHAFEQLAGIAYQGRSFGDG
jgi:pullulanase/glycogen debranching enzyme